MLIDHVTYQLPFFAAAVYSVLIGILYFQSSQRRRAGRFLIYFLAVSVLWSLLRGFITAETGLTDVIGELLVAGTLLLGLATQAFGDWPHRRWLFFGTVALALIVGLDLVERPLVIGGSLLLNGALTADDLLTFLLWGGLSTYLSYRAWHSYKQTRLPWHANRLLFWTVSLILVFAGEALLLAWQPRLLTAARWSFWIGHGLRLVGVIGLTYAVTFHRIFDVRARFRYILALIAYALVSALPAAVAIYLIQQITRPLNNVYAALIILAALALGFLVYRPFSRLVESGIQRFFLGEGLDPGVVVRNYSQAISKTLDLSQLSLVIIGTIKDLLEINRGALLLVTEMEDQIKVDPIPALGRIPRTAVRFATDSILLRALRAQHHPLLQYEIDFNPAYEAMSETEQRWLSEMAMELYVPVMTGADLIGIIALGPKRSGHPYRANELELVQILADQTVVALQNARLYRALNSQNERVRLLNADLRQQNERLGIMDQVKSDFITIASHELRTPLTQVKGYAEILAAMNEDGTLTREQTREIVGHISRASVRLENLIAAMLDASQLDVAGIQLVFSETNLEMVIKQAVEPLQQAMRERRIQLRLDGVTELPAIIGDHNRLLQAFQNIIGNAVKYTPDGGLITVRAQLVPSEDPALEFVELAISDTGIGIEARFHQLIFEKFFRIGDPQLHSTGSTKFKGAGPGLGLPIAKGVIEAHAGHIWVESEGEDEVRLPGSTFHVVLPVNPPAVIEQKPATKPEERQLLPAGEWVNGRPWISNPSGRITTTGRVN